MLRGWNARQHEYVEEHGKWRYRLSFAVWHLAPDEKVEDEEDKSHETGVEEGGEERGRLRSG